MYQDEKYFVKMRGSPVGVGLIETDWPEPQVNLDLKKWLTQLNVFISMYEKSHITMDDRDKKQ